MSERYMPPPVPGAKMDTPFPAVFGAALAFGAFVAVLSQFSRKTATIVSLTMLAAIVLRRQLVTQFNDLVTTITGR